ncbi:MAG: DUF3048 domain-containing protein [Mycobacteriales bacterium]|nr:DUF3048 domain-containing protein [Frankia sp.]
MFLHLLAHRRMRAVAAVVAAAALAACSANATTERKPAVTTSVARPRATTAPQLRSPFTGLPVNQLAPAIAMKIDNAAPARPQAGVDKADVVYQELVEGGITRLLAIFSSQQPRLAGPVRSVRENDLDLLREYGRVLFAYAGGNRRVYDMARAAPLVDGSYDAATPAYHLLAGRHRPYSTFVSVPKLVATKPGAAEARDIGLRFGPLPAALAASPRVSAATFAFSPYARTSFTWSPTAKAWVIGLDRARTSTIDGRPLAFSNVVVQYVRIRPSRFSDVLGNMSPFSVTTGKGRAVIFRDGRKIEAYWSRAGVTSGTHFTDAQKHDIALAPGPTWVLLAPLGRPLSLG